MKNRPFILSKFLLVFAFLGLAACEPMTEEELAAFQQRQFQASLIRDERAAERVVFCEGNIDCYETQDLVAEQCKEMVRNRFTSRRSDQYGNILFSEIDILNFVNFRKDPGNSLGYGGNNIILLTAVVRSNSSSNLRGLDITQYMANCIILRDSTEIIDIDYDIR